MSVRQARGWRTWPLRKQLVVGVSAVVTTVLVTVGTMSVLTLRASVTGIVDTQLSSAAEGFSRSVTKYRASPLPTGAMPPADAMKPLTYLIGQAPGNIVVLMRDGQVVDSAMFGDGDATAAPPSAVRELTERAGTLDEPVNLWLPDLGKYRLLSRPAGPGEELLTAASLRQASAAATRETIVVAALTALALIVTAAGTLAIVRVALRPLGRVASTAAEVAETPLNRDRYAITPRVPEGDTDARTEVGLVGDTLNRLLDNVERALTEVSASDRRMRQFTSTLTSPYRVRRRLTRSDAGP